MVASRDEKAADGAVSAPAPIKKSSRAKRLSKWFLGISVAGCLLAGADAALYVWGTGEGFLVTMSVNMVSLYVVVPLFVIGAAFKAKEMYDLNKEIQESELQLEQQIENHLKKEEASYKAFAVCVEELNTFLTQCTTNEQIRNLQTYVNEMEVQLAKMKARLSLYESFPKHMRFATETSNLAELNSNIVELQNKITTFKTDKKYVKISFKTPVPPSSTSFNNKSISKIEKPSTGSKVWDFVINSFYAATTLGTATSMLAQAVAAFSAMAVLLVPPFLYATIVGVVLLSAVMAYGYMTVNNKIASKEAGLKQIQEANTTIGEYTGKNGEINKDAEVFINKRHALAESLKDSPAPESKISNLADQSLENKHELEVKQEIKPLNPSKQLALENKESPQIVKTAVSNLRSTLRIETSLSRQASHHDEIKNEAKTAEEKLPRSKSEVTATHPTKFSIFKRTQSFALPNPKSWFTRKPS